MRPDIPDMERFERLAFRSKNVLGLLLKFSRRLLDARLAGVVYGTDHTGEKFLPPHKWDRGIVHRLDGTGMAGLGFKWFGPMVLRWIRLSPIRLFAVDSHGRQVASQGVIAQVMRKHGEYYASGIKILFIDHIPQREMRSDPSGGSLAVIAYDGIRFEVLPDIQVNMDIIHWFKPDNFVSVYIPDYGAIVFNTVDPWLFKKSGEGQMYSRQLKTRFDRLISAIETASIAHLGQAKGRRAAKIIWRKERNLRHTFLELNEKADRLDALKNHLRAVGAVTAEQLNMTPVIEPNGVYAFLDMVESGTIRNCLTPREFLLVLNLCHEIVAETAAAFGCRVDNFLGDAVFLENMETFDEPGKDKPSGLPERLMIMTMALASVFRQVRQLKQGQHPLDRENRIHTLVKAHAIDIGFRAGMAYGAALVGPLGSFNRRIVTAIGKPVNIASRLESTGKNSCIHIEKKLLEILNNSIVSKDTKALWHMTVSDRHKDSVSDIRFFPFFKDFFGLGPGVVQKMPPVSYKEFVNDTTYLICCDPEIDKHDVCAGI
ncbi:MAG: adenylate/guanylate cyclase domain-containing protein [Desulfotignum sp.]|nr:adenylate/guanylate cyclase domain-containing protein [Desulfotignum sp.]MCF8124611.1 adenylate/guanylate cyclase domain-containing protein [Desulfotignum sp.]